MGDLEKRINDALATTLAGIPWIAPYQRGTITLDDVPDHALLAGAVDLTLTLIGLVEILAREVDESRGGHDFGE